MHQISELHYQYFRMAENQQDDAIECEYVYKESKDVPHQEATILGDPYDDESSDNDEAEGPSIATPSSSNEKSRRPAKTRRQRSRYDEDMYALPHPEGEEEIRVRKQEEKMRAQEKLIFAMRVTAAVLVCMLLASVTANIYCLIKTVNERGKKILHQHSMIIK